MIKRFIVGILVVGMSAGLIYGGIYRTISRADNGERTFQTQKDQLNYGDTSDIQGQGRGGQGENRNIIENEQIGIETKYSSEHVSLAGDSTDLVSFNGTVTEVDENLLKILSEESNEIIIENRPWWFASDAGFFAEIGDSINMNGFYETADDFEVSYIHNLTKGIETQIRESNGRPLWARNGRGS